MDFIESFVDNILVRLGCIYVSLWLYKGPKKLIEFFKPVSQNVPSDPCIKKDESIKIVQFNEILTSKNILVNALIDY